MKRTIERCDRCGKEAETEEDKTKLALITFSIGTHITNYSTLPNRIFPTFQHWDKEICAECREKLGLTVQVMRQEVSAACTPTFDEMVREIVRQEIQQQ